MVIQVLKLMKYISKRKFVSTTNKKNIELEKQELFSTCINLLKELSKESKSTICHLLLYVSERQPKFDQHIRAIAEHRISNALFDLEINSTKTTTITRLF